MSSQFHTSPSRTTDASRSQAETYTLYYVKADRTWPRQASDRKSYLIALASTELGHWQRCRIEDPRGNIVYAAG